MTYIKKKSTIVIATNQRQRGRVDLAFEHISGITRAARCAVQPPLQLSRARYDNPARPEQVSLTLIHLGGILSGDRYTIAVALADAASARITTAAATQVYRMPSGEATQDLHLQLGPASRLEWLPEPTILFGGARFTQTTSITLGAGARLALLDVLVPGRLARGELYEFERYAMRLEVYNAGGRILAAERALLEPRRHSMVTPGMFGATPVLGSLYVLGDHVDAERGCALVAERNNGLAAAALPNSCGLLVRALGSTPSAVRAALLDVWAALGGD